MVPVESSPDRPPTVDAAIAVALDALDRLAELGEEVDDEWQYVQDLTADWRSRLELVATERAGEALAPEHGAAVVRVAAEAAGIDDPHRAIDWLSTLPQVALLALAERP